MNRQIASKHLRDCLDDNNLRDWHIRLTMDITKPFLGMCSFKDKTIILNAHHIDTHPDVEVLDTIKHEVAHAIVGFIHGHDETWKNKAKELGALPQECSTMSLSPEAINAIRSGADLKVEFEEQVIRTPKYTVHKIQEKCDVCGRVAKTRTQTELKTPTGRKLLRVLECGHAILVNADSFSNFEDLVFDAVEGCAHIWGKGKYYSFCQKCSARRLYPYQVEGARALEKANGRFGIFDEQGLGKTIQATAYLSFHKQDAWPFLWVTKSSMLVQHAREIVRVCGPYSIPQIITKGSQRIFPNFNVVISYDLLRNLDLAMFKDFKCVVLDECQQISNPDSTRTQCIRRIVKAMPNVKIIPTSGTPWKNRGSEFFVALNLLDPRMFNDFARFKMNYVSTYWDGNKNKEGGFIDPKKFRDKIAHIAIRRERLEVLPDLPSVNRTKLLTELPDYTQKAYREEEDKLISLLDTAAIDGDEGSFASTSKIMQTLMVMKQIIGIAKVPQSVSFAKEFLEETDRKLVIFVHHIKCGEMIYEQMKTWCAANGEEPPLKIASSMNPLERANAAHELNYGKSRIMVASTLAAGEGINLQNACSDFIMHERQWNPANEEQAEGRFARIGQEAENINSTYVHAKDTCDTILDGIVENKRVQFHESMNKGEMPKWNESEILGELVRAIKEQRKNRSK